jgi:hypothetical protein
MNQGMKVMDQHHNTMNQAQIIIFITPLVHNGQFQKNTLQNHSIHSIPHHTYPNMQIFLIKNSKMKKNLNHRHIERQRHATPPTSRHIPSR